MYIHGSDGDSMLFGWIEIVSLEKYAGCLEPRFGTIHDAIVATIDGDTTFPS